MDHLWIFISLGLLGWFWHDSLRAREKALGIARIKCIHYQVQMLDQTVSTVGVSLYWGDEGLRLRRRYRFDYSDGGNDRYQGSLVLRGLVLEDFSLATLDGESITNPDSDAASAALHDQEALSRGHAADLPARTVVTGRTSGIVVPFPIHSAARPGDRNGREHPE